MDPSEVDGWLARKAESEEVPNAEKYLSLHEVSGQTVKKTLAKIGKYKDKEGVGFIELERSAATGRTELRSFLCKDEFLHYSVELASVWVAATKGTGELYFAGMLTAGFFYKLSVAPGAVTLVELAGSARRQQPAYQQILARVEARLAELGL